MSAIRAEDEQSWRAPGVEAGASPLLASLLRRLDGVLDELHATSLGALADADVARLLDAVTAASSAVIPFASSSKRAVFIVRMASRAPRSRASMRFR